MPSVKLDSCSIIYLAKCSLLDLLSDTYDRVILTKSVFQEAIVRGKEEGHTDAYILDQAIHDGRIQVLDLTTSDRRTIKQMPILEKLGHGERETIYEALKQGCTAVLDDRDSRTAANALRITHQSCISLLLDALFRGKVTFGDFDEALERLSVAAGIPLDRVHEARRIARLFEG